MALTNYLEDDWDDNSLSSRTSPSKDVFYEYDDGGTGNLLKGVYRPLWTIDSGSPSATSNVLLLSDGSSTQQAVKTPTELSVGSWSWDWAFNSTPSSNNATFATIFEDGQNRLWWTAHSDSSYDLRKTEAGSQSAIISSSWSVDTTAYTTKITRDSYGGHELFRDGSSQGTGSDSFLPRLEPAVIRIWNTADADWEIDNLVIK